MAGHSKWANIKHKKAKVDAQKGKIFTKLVRELIVAAREGGADPETNFSLRIAIQKAKEANMPNDNINRAIKKGTGEIEGESYESINYEGYGPAGVALLLDVMTDNRNRTVGEIRHFFSRHGGNLGETGCVGWMFNRKGVIVIEKTKEMPDDDTIMMVALEAGAEDFEANEESIEIICSAEEFEHVSEELTKKGIKTVSAEITMIPENYIKITDKDTAKELLSLVEVLEEHDDVQNVYGNFDIDSDILDQLTS